MGSGRAAHAEEPARSPPGRRPACDLGHHPRPQDRLPLVRLPARVRPLDHDLQPLQPLVPAALLGRSRRSARRLGGGDEVDGPGLHLRQGSSLRPRWKRGAKSQAIGPSRGGQTTKVHALTDLLGRPYAFDLTPGNVSDTTAAGLLLPRAVGARYLLADKGYDANAIRKTLRTAGAVPVIPGRITRKRKIAYDKARYRDRHRIENTFCRLKDFRRVATRYDKLARNFLSTVAIATLVAFWL